MWHPTASIRSLHVSQDKYEAAIMGDLQAGNNCKGVSLGSWYLGRQRALQVPLAAG